MKFSAFLLIGCVMTWSAVVFAADGEVSQMDPARVVQEILEANPGLSQEEARTLAEQAAADVAGEKELAEPPPQAGTEQEKALMGEVNARVQELQNQGMGEEAIHETIEAEMGGKLRDVAEQQGRTSEGFREQMEGHSLERLNELYREGKPVWEALERQGSGQGQESSSRETIERGSFERPTEGSSREIPEIYREAPETSTREIEQREAPETPTREVEQREAPEMTHEMEQREAPQPAEQERPEQYREYAPPQG